MKLVDDGLKPIDLQCPTAAPDMGMPDSRGVDW